VGHRAGVLGELALAQHAHVLDALDGAGRALPAMSMLNSWSRKTVRPSFRLSWNQSRQVTRLPVQLWKYSWPTTLSMLAKSVSVAVAGLASTYLVLKMFRPLFSIAPMLKSPRRRS
jgi:hypothetical protein